MNDIKSNILESYINGANKREKDIIEDWKYNEIEWFKKYISIEYKILDLGAGTGVQSLLFKSSGYENIIALDFCSEMIKLCATKGLSTIQGDYYNLNIKNEYDAIWSMNSLVHIPKKDFKLILNNIKAALKEEGIFYLGLYGGFDNEGIWENDNYIPKRFFSYYLFEDLKNIISESFEILESKEISVENTDLKYQSFICKKRVILS